MSNFTLDPMMDAKKLVQMLNVHSILINQKKLEEILLQIQ